MNNNFITTLWRHKLTLLLLSLAAGLLYFVSSYSFLEVEVAGQPDNLTYTIQNQQTQKTDHITTKTPKLKRLIPRGSYEVMVKSDAGSTLAITKTGGFLQTTSVSLEIRAERAREFIGNNPKPCFFLYKHLYSMECDNSLESLVRHVPPTTSRPGYTENISLPINALGEGLVLIDDNVHILVQILSEEDDSGSHFLYPFDGGSSLGRPVVLTSLDKSGAYSISSYKTGFVTYKNDFSDIKYYSQLGEDPEDITLAAPSLNGVKPTGIFFGEESIMTVYSDARPEDVHDTEESQPEVNTELVIQDAGTSRSIVLSGPAVSDALVCGSAKVCVLEGDRLAIYDVSGNKQRLLYEVRSVNRIMMLANDLLALRTREVLNIDVDRQIGYVDYSLGDYQYCGIQPERENYILCLIDGASQKSALYINRRTAAADNIDKQVFQLANLPEIDSVSAHGKLIYISPNLGPTVYLESIGGYGYPKEVRRSVGALIDQSIRKIGIDRNKYQIINTLE